jgi:hypothetical protein
MKYIFTIIRYGKIRYGEQNTGNLLNELIPKAILLIIKAFRIAFRTKIDWIIQNIQGSKSKL